MNGLAKLNRLNNSTWGLDKSFRAAYYSLLLVKWVGKKAGAREARVAQADALLGAIGNYRILTRFTGLPATVAELLEGGEGGDSLQQLLSWTRTVSMLLYYPLEHLAWAKDAGVIRSKRVDSATLWVLSCRLWLLYVIAQITSRLLTLNTLSREIRRRDLSYDQKRDCRAQLRANRLQLVCNASDLCLAGNWSLRSSPLGDFSIGLCGAVGSAAGLLHSFTS